MKHFYCFCKWLCNLVPLVFCAVEFGAISPQGGELVITGYVVKSSFFSLLTMGSLLLITKRYWLTRYIEEKAAIVANLKSIIIVETDKIKREKASSELKKINLTLRLLQALLPTIFLLIGYFAVFALERAMVKLGRVYLFAVLFFVLGVIFSVLEENARIRREK